MEYVKGRKKSTTKKYSETIKKDFKRKRKTTLGKKMIKASGKVIKVETVQQNKTAIFTNESMVIEVEELYNH